MLEKLDTEAKLGESPFALYVLFPNLRSALSVVPSPLPYLRAAVKSVEDLPLLAAATSLLSSSTGAVAGEAKGKVGKKDKKGTAGASAGPAATFTNDDVVPPVLGAIDWTSAGLMSSLKIVFDAALIAAFPQLTEARAGSVITRCGNAAHGDFQCNNAMGLSKALKGLEGYQGECLHLVSVSTLMCLCLL